MEEMENKKEKQKKIYKKRNEFKFNFIFNNSGETFDKIIERSFSNYILRK